MVRKELPPPLPITGTLPVILQALESARAVILKAPPGTGKTTRVPPALLDAPFLQGKHREIWILEPRRIAAKLAARRVAEEQGSRVGELVGYHFRFEREQSAQTRILFLTEGMFLRRCLDNPELTGVGCLILDEFHERHLHTDLALNYAKRLQTTTRADLRIIVMSATLETGRLESFLPQSRLVETDSPLFPIQTQFLDNPPEKRLPDLVVQAARRWRDNPEGGDCLIFLPGMGDIRRCEELLRPALPQIQIETLHGDLSREEQERALQRQRARKVILSTNIAESSVTIEGIRTVIDSGLHRTMLYSPWTGVPFLKTVPISRQSAIQRMGRAGRQGEGFCYRLYTKHDFDTRPLADTPEILRAELSQTLLEIKSLGIADPRALDWYERPSESQLTAGMALLHRLGALESDAPSARLTAQGVQMAALGMHPRLSRLVLAGASLGILEEAACLAAQIQEDELEGLDVSEQVSERRLSDPARKTFRQIVNNVGARSAGNKDRVAEKLATALLVAFPDRVSRKRKVARGKGDEFELVLSSGGSALVRDPNHHLQGEYFIALGLRENKAQHQLKSQLYADHLCPVTENALFELKPSPIAERVQLRWNSERGEVRATQALVYDNLVLTEAESPPPDRKLAGALLLREGLGWESVEVVTLEEMASRLQQLDAEGDYDGSCVRYRLLAANPVSKLVLPSPEELKQRLWEVLGEKVSLREVREGDVWNQVLLAIDASLPRLLDQHLPAFVSLPSGRRIKIHYEPNREPWAESRLQDFFGLRQTPQLLMGRVPLVLHLLAPNKRAVQVTKDLQGFWTKEYAKIRNQLSRRYPRHAWPEDPSQIVKD